ncbi:UNVERIFIED_CONTAM: hypothetical protein FKN15_042558 [Acipenser sinensis]
MMKSMRIPAGPAARVIVAGQKRGQAQSPIKISKPKDLCLVVNKKVLAERNQAVAPVGAWVESGLDCQQHAGITALQTEELFNEVHRDKAESLRRFQREVRRRVAQRARFRKKQQLQKSYEAAEREGCVVQQSCDAAWHLTPKKNTCKYHHQRELAICSPGSRWVIAQGLGVQEEEAGPSPGAFHQQANRLSKVMKQARRRLAACQIVPTGEVTSELPGGIWRVSPTRDKPVSRLLPPAGEEEEDSEEVPLVGQHDPPLGLQENPTDIQAGKTVSFQSQQVCGRLLREPYPTGPCPGFSTDYRAALVLCPGVDEEEIRKQRQTQYLMYRRLFMDIEREQVKEQRRQREHHKRIACIKADKERQRREVEKRILGLSLTDEDREDLGERERELLERMRLEEHGGGQEAKERTEKMQKLKETTRYIEALRAQMREKMKLRSVDLPPLCCCGEEFWDSHPDTCANNCVFYKNPRAYAKALQSVISSCDMWEGNRSNQVSMRRIANAHARSPRK